MKDKLAGEEKSRKSELRCVVPTRMKHMRKAAHRWTYLIFLVSWWRADPSLHRSRAFSPPHTQDLWMRVSAAVYQRGFELRDHLMRRDLPAVGCGCPVSM